MFLSETEKAAVGGIIDTAFGEIVEGPLGHADDVVFNEASAFARAVFRMFQRAFPLQHRPAVEIILGELGKHRAEIDMPVAQRAETSRPVDPALITAINAGTAGRIELGILDVKGADALVVNVDEIEIVHRLKDKWEGS